MITMTCNHCHAKVETTTVPEALDWSKTHDDHCPTINEQP